MNASCLIANLATGDQDQVFNFNLCLTVFSQWNLIYLWLRMGCVYKFNVSVNPILIYLLRKHYMYLFCFIKNYSVSLDLCTLVMIFLCYLNPLGVGGGRGYL